RFPLALKGIESINIELEFSVGEPLGDSVNVFTEKMDIDHGAMKLLGFVALYQARLAKNLSKSKPSLVNLICLLSFRLRIQLPQIRQLLGDFAL
ncbi:MAG: hypothetical protein RL083_238, partial [Pseudomonadota bacterium]